MSANDLTRQEVIRALRHCGSGATYVDCEKCPMHSPVDEDCSGALMLRAAELLEVSEHA